MSLPYHYRVFGLQIASEIPCPELLEGTGTPEVRITYGPIPTALADVHQAGVGYQAGAGQVLLSVEGVARFWIRDGQAIVVEPAAQSDDASVRLFLLGAACGTLLLQRGVLPLRGCAVQGPQGCIAFVGQTGTGKSTLAAALLRRHYTLVSDDICAMTFGADGVPLVAPGYPYLKLWPDALAYLGHDPQQYPRLRPALEKRLCHVIDTFCLQALVLQRVYILAPTQLSGRAVQRLTPREGMMALQMLTYQQMLLDVLGQRALHFRHCGRVVRRVPLAKVTWPASPLDLEPLVDLLEEDMR